MFTSSDITETDLSDTMGQLTYVPGGNLKSLLPAPCHRSPPLVVEGYNVMTEGRTMGRVLSRFEDLPLQIILFEWEKNHENSDR